MRASVTMIRERGSPRPELLTEERMNALKPPPDDAPTDEERVAAARQALLEGVGAEIAASFPGITRLGGQVVAALYLADVPRPMDELSVELGRSKGNISAILGGLGAAGLIGRRSGAGARQDP